MSGKNKSKTFKEIEKLSGVNKVTIGDATEDRSVMTAINKGKMKDQIKQELKKENSQSQSSSDESQGEDGAKPSVDPIEARFAAMENSLQQTLSSIKEKNEERIEQIQQEHQASVEKMQSIIDAKDQELEQTKQNLAAVEKSESRLADLFKLNGMSEKDSQNTTLKFPNVNTVTTIGSENAEGIYKEALDLIDNSTFGKPVLTGMNVGYDYRELDSFTKQNESALMAGMEAWAKNNGFLTGGKANKMAATVSGDILGGFLKTLSSLERQTHRPGFIYWQFANSVLNFEKNMGDTVQVFRSAYQDAPTDSDDWLLGTSDTFTDLDSSDTQPLKTGVVEVRIEEWGMAKQGVVNNRAIRIPTFVMAYSMIDLRAILNRNLTYNYNTWLDLKIRELWRATSAVIYNNNKAIEDVPANMLAGSDGTMTADFLINLYAYMHTLQILTFIDGCYGLVVHPIALAQLKADAEKKWEAPTEADLMNLSNVLYSAGNPDRATGRVEGYQGKYYNFHIFLTNASSVGNPGVSEGVRDEALGVGNTTTRTSYAFGDQTVAHGIADPYEVRIDEVSRYGRKNDFIWLSYEGFLPMDVDPVGYADTSDVPQQLRVIDVRTLDTAI